MDGTQVKEQVRALIFGGLADPVRKIRLACVRGPSSRLSPPTEIGRASCRERVS